MFTKSKVIRNMSPVSLEPFLENIVRLMTKVIGRRRILKEKLK